MKLHSEGRKEYLKVLKRQRTAEARKIDNAKVSKTQKLKLFQRLKLKYEQLFKDSGQSLFLGH